MQKFTIKFDQRNLNKIFRCADKVNALAVTQMDEFPRAASEDYANKVLKAINSVRWKYPGRYNQRYMAWKLANYKVHVPWKLASDLVKALKSYKISVTSNEASYIGGVKAGIYDSGGKSWFSKPGKQRGKPKEIAMYGRVVERTKPMFVPIFVENKPRYKKQFDKVINQFRRIWR